MNKLLSKLNTEALLLSMALICVLLAGCKSCNDTQPPIRQKDEVFYHELDSVEKAWVDNSKKTNRLHDSITWFNVWAFAHSTDSPQLYRRRLYFPQHNKGKK